MFVSVFPASTRAKRVDKEGEEVLAHCEKHSKELAGLCKLLLYFSLPAIEVSLDISCTDCENQEKQFSVTYAS